MSKHPLIGSLFLLAAACNSSTPISTRQAPVLVQPVVVVEPGQIPAAIDGFTLGDVSIENNTLTVVASYGGGCESHDFRLYWDGSVLESFPAQAHLTLIHNGNGDACEAFITEELQFDLSEVALVGGEKVILSIKGGDVNKSVAFQPVKPAGPKPLAFGNTAKIEVDEEVEVVEVVIPRTGLHKLPLVSVAEEFASFECEIVELTKTAKFDTALQELVDVYLIGIAWVAGADLSGCLVEIENPYNGQVATVELFMSF